MKINLLTRTKFESKSNKILQSIPKTELVIRRCKMGITTIGPVNRKLDFLTYSLTFNSWMVFHNFPNSKFYLPPNKLFKKQMRFWTSWWFPTEQKRHSRLDFRALRNFWVGRFQRICLQTPIFQDQGLKPSTCLHQSTFISSIWSLRESKIRMLLSLE